MVILFMNQIKVELQEYMGNDRSIAESAWTSSLDYQKKKIKTDNDVEKIIKMLVINKHSTPFESIVFKFWIKMPIQTDRQHMTHRIASHNGMSGRYRTMPNDWLNASQDIENICEKVFNTNGILHIFEYNKLCETANTFYNRSILAYKDAEKNNKITNKEYKRLREFFRGVLPQNNMTERVTIMNLRSFSNYQKLRNSEHAQPEIQQVAKLMLEEIKKHNICPIVLNALESNNWEI